MGREREQNNGADRPKQAKLTIEDYHILASFYRQRDWAYVFKTVSDVAKEQGMTHKKAKYRLERLRQHGLLQIQQDKDGKNSWPLFYEPIRDDTLRRQIESIYKDTIINLMRAGEEQ